MKRHIWSLATVISVSVVAAMAIAGQAWAQQAQTTTPTPSTISSQQSAQSADGLTPVVVAEGVFGALASGLVGGATGGYLVRRRLQSSPEVQSGGLQLQTLAEKFDSEKFRMRRARAARDLLEDPPDRPSSLDNILAHFQTFERLLKRGTLDEDLTMDSISEDVIDWAGAAERFRPPGTADNQPEFRDFYALLERVLRSRGTKFHPPSDKQRQRFLEDESSLDE